MQDQTWGDKCPPDQKEPHRLGRSRLRDFKGTRYSKQYSKQKTQTLKSFKIIKLRNQFRLPRLASKDVHGRLFLCLKSSETKGFRAIGFRTGLLSSRRFGIPSPPMLFLGYQNDVRGGSHAYQCSPPLPSANQGNQDSKKRLHPH